MNSTEKKITETLAKFGEPMAGNVWRVQGTVVIYHKALERIAAQAQIRFDPPTIVRAERDEAVILVSGRMGERLEWSIGEALVGVNYRISGKQAAYVYAMAEKRAKDRVILKLIELHGLVYSEEEADEFKQGRPGLSEPQAALGGPRHRGRGRGSGLCRRGGAEAEDHQGPEHQCGHGPDAARRHAADSRRTARRDPGRDPRFRQGTAGRAGLAIQEGRLSLSPFRPGADEPSAPGPWF